MVEFLSPGVFIEEIPSQVQIIQAVSTSNLGVAGFTPKGPTDEATLVTSFDDFTRQFGEIVTESYLGLTMAAYFANGGRRAFIVRVVPSDATAADGYIQSTTTDQQIETGTGAQTAFTKTASTSLLKDNAGFSPLVASSVALRWRSAGTAVTAAAMRNRANTADVAVAGAASFEAIIDPKATRTVPGASSPNGDIYYRSVGDGRSDITIRHVVSGNNTPRSISVTGTAITVNLATDGSAAIQASETATSVAASVNGNTLASALVSATALGDGSAVTAAIAASNLLGGVPAFDQALDRVVRGTMTVVFNPSGGDRSIIIPTDYASLTPEITTIRAIAGSALVDTETLTVNDGVNVPTVFEFDSSAAITAGRVAITFTGGDSASTVATKIALAINTVGASLAVTAVASGERVLLTHDSGGTITLTEAVADAGFAVGTKFRFDHRSGFLSIKFAGSDDPTSAGTGNLRATFTPADAPVPAASSGNKTSHTAVDNGSGQIASTSLVGLGTITYADGAYSFTTAVAPHNLARILATYQIKAWHIHPISKGAWGNDLRIDVAGNADFLDITTGTYSRFNVNVLLKNSKGDYVLEETFEELDMSDSTSAMFFPDVVNELSDLITVDEPAGDEAPGQLNGVARTVVIAGGNESGGSRNVTFTLPDSPVAARSLTITYVDTTTGSTKTVTDNGLGALTGDVDPAGTNTITYATGALDVTLAPSDSIKAGTLVTATYSTEASETTHSEALGDATVGFTSGSDGTFTSSTYSRTQFTSPSLSTTYQGIYALNRIDEIMQVILPDFAGDVTVTKDLLDYVNGRESQPSGADRFLILTTPMGSSPQEAVDWFRYELARYSKYAALYWPWIKVADPLSNNRPLTIPPLGHVAGVYARTDTRKNVGKSPGGTDDGALSFFLDLEMNPSQGERDFVYPNKINPIISTPQTGTAIWGVRTIASPSDSEWRYINARRLFMFLEKSIFNATHWVVFENNGPGLWARVSAQLTGFLGSLFGQGLFAGTTPSQAFFVVVDSSNNSSASIEAGQIIIDVGAAANKPAEFVRIRFTQIAA